MKTYEKVCPVCKKRFIAISTKHYLCSDACRKQHISESHKIYYSEYKNQVKLKQYHKEHYIPVIKYCATCGDQLPHGKQKFCLKCLLNEYLHGDSFKAYTRLKNRGYTGQTIMQEIQRLGL